MSWARRLWWISGATDSGYRRQKQRNSQATRYAGLQGVGYTLAAIARQFDIDYQELQGIMHAACPPFVIPPPKPHTTAQPELLPPITTMVEVEEPAPCPDCLRRVGHRPGCPRLPRPAWSYPDESLRRLAQEAHAEIQANLHIGARRPRTLLR